MTKVKSQAINNIYPMELKTIGDIKIYLTNEHKFSAIIDGKDVERSSIRDLEKLISGNKRPVKAITIDYGYTLKPKVVNIIGTSGGSFKEIGGSTISQYQSVYEFDEELLKRILDILTKRKVAVERTDRDLSVLLRTARLLTPKKLAEQQNIAKSLTAVSGVDINKYIDESVKDIYSNNNHIHLKELCNDDSSCTPVCEEQGFCEHRHDYRETII